MKLFPLFVYTALIKFFSHKLNNKYTDCNYINLVDYSNCIIYLNKNNDDILNCIKENNYININNKYYPDENKCKNITLNYESQKQRFDEIFKINLCLINIKDLIYKNKRINCNKNIKKLIK